MDLGLTGKKALVAGGGRGIGKAIAMELAREGADVVVASRSHDELERTAQEISDATGRLAYPLAFDVTNTEQVNWGVKQAAALLGGLHILVNSAALPGGSPEAIGPVETVDEEILKWDFDVKFVGALRCAKAAIPFLKKAGWGRIINISGGNARVAGNLSGGARNVSMVHFTKSLSIQLGRHGITVNCIHPGTTRTERTTVTFAQRGEVLGVDAAEIERQDFAAGSPAANAIGRMVDAQEVGYVAAYLASDKAWAVTGEVLAAGGGVGNAVYY